MIKTLREYVKEAEENGRAIGHFNISNLETLHGIYQAAKNVSAAVGYPVPVIVGVSEGEEAFMGREEAIALVRAIQTRDDYPIFLNADHHYDFDKIALDIDAGFDAIVFDGAKLSFEENVALTKKCVDYARKAKETTRKDILIEAELGYIGSGSDIKEKVPDGAGIETSPEDAKKFVEATGVDLFAPSVGNIHGVVRGHEFHLNFPLITEIRKTAGVPLVLHGGSGLADDDFRQAIKAGISIVHISTELRLAYTEALKQSLADNPKEIAPYKILKSVEEAVTKVAEKKLKLFNKV